MSEPLPNTLLVLFETGGRGLMLWSWQAFLLLLLTLLLVKFDRTRSPATRCHLWLAGLIVVAGMPLWTEVARVFPLHKDAWTSVSLVLPQSAAPISGEPAPAPVNPPAAASPAVPRGAELWATLFLAWLTGFLFSVMKMIWAYWNLYRLSRDSSPDQEYSGSLPPGIRLKWSEKAVSPILAGIFRPVIVLPAGMRNWTTADEQTAVICHELSHFRRGDHVASVFQAILNAVFFFHPMVRHASRQLSWEREFACDSEVLAAGHDAEKYADIILRVAERGIAQRLGVQPAFNPTRQILERRIHMILNDPRPVYPSRVRRVFTVAKAATVLVVMLFLLTPRVPVAAESQPPFASAQATAIVNPESTIAKTIEPAGPVEARAIPPVPAPPRASSAGTAAAPTAGPVQLPFPSGRFYGSVFDQTGALVPGVKVSMSNPQERILSEQLSDEIGGFGFVGLPSGSYVLEVTVPGFRILRADITLLPGQNLRQNAVLSIESATQQVEVSARAGSPPPPPPTTAGPQRIRVGGNLRAPRLVTRVDPVYPQGLRDLGIAGTVVLASVIGTDGIPIGIHALGVQTHPGLTGAAIAAVRQWRYEPTLLNGVPVEVVNNVTILFTLVP